MEENKNINPETEIEENVTSEEVKEVETPAEVQAEELQKEKKAKAPKVKKEKALKPKKIRNQAFFKKGSYSAAITAAFIAGVIVLNILVSALSSRFVLEFDMSAEKLNSISQENIDYIRDIEQEVSITVCADPDSYVDGYMAYYAQQYNVTEDATEYYRQTINLIDLYAEYNKNFTVEYVDTQSTEFSKIATEYSSQTINYGDIIVAAEKNGNKRSKIVGFEDIYLLTEDDTYASYGMTTATVEGNDIETALTSAIAYVTSAETKTIAFITGHSKTDYTADYQALLKANNYEITVISDTIITSIPEEVDALVIAAPSTDFIGSELDVISKFLENDGKLGKGLVFIADTNSPYLTNLYDLLAQWGILVDEGILYETDSNNHMPDDPLTLGTYAASEDEICKDINVCITGNNIPLSVSSDKNDGIETEVMVATPETTVAAPVGTTASWTDAGNYESQSYAALIQAAKEDYDEDNNLIGSYVMAFCSTDFIYSAYNEQSSVSNKNVTLAAAERAAGAEDIGISFVSKIITNESFADQVTDSDANVIRVIFMAVIPVILIALGIYIYIKRRNA